MALAGGAYASVGVGQREAVCAAAVRVLFLWFTHAFTVAHIALGMRHNAYLGAQAQCTMRSVVILYSQP